MRLNEEERQHIIILSLILVVFILVTILVKRGGKGDEESEQRVVEQVESEVPRSEPHSFDPNTAGLAELLEVGLPKESAISLIRYRAAGKVFRIKEEVAGIYGMSDSTYFAIEPYIVISEEFRFKPKVYKYDTTIKKEAAVVSPPKVKEVAAINHIEISPFRVDTLSKRYLIATGIFSEHQAEIFIKWRDISGMPSADYISRCYVVNDSIANILNTYAIFPKAYNEPQEYKKRIKTVDINHADSAALVALPGIGSKSAMAIIEYREMLGGYHSTEQLLELNAVVEDNYDKFLPYISLKNDDISKIDVNFASAQSFINHPYITRHALRRLMSRRQTKGGWRNLGEMIDDKIFKAEDARRLQPYLFFDTIDVWDKTIENKKLKKE